MAHRDPYRVDGRSPGDEWIRGSPLPSTPRPLDPRQERCAAIRGYLFRGSRSPPGDVSVKRYDVVDREGRLDAILTLPPNEAVVGLGPSSVYVLETSELDLQRLRRHAWA